MRSLSSCVFGAGVVLFASTMAMAGMWTNPSGEADHFWYYNGQDVNGRFGNPDVYGDTISFPLTTFQANAFNGAPEATDGDTVSWDVQCKPTFVVDYVVVWAYGTYALTGEGSYVDADLEVAINEIYAPGRSWSDPLTSYPAFPLYYNPAPLPDPPNNGWWYGLSEMDFSGLLEPPGEWLHIELDTLIKAWGAIGGGAEINTQYQDLTINFTFIPEPGTLALLGLGLLAVVRRRVH